MELNKSTAIREAVAELRRRWGAWQRENKNYRQRKKHDWYTAFSKPPQATPLNVRKLLAEQGIDASRNLIRQVMKNDRRKSRTGTKKWEEYRAAEVEAKTARKAERARRKPTVNKSAEIRKLIAEGKENSYILRSMAERGLAVSISLVNTVRRRAPKPKVWTLTAQDILDQLAAHGIRIQKLDCAAKVEEHVPLDDLVGFLLWCGRKNPRV